MVKHVSFKDIKENEMINYLKENGYLNGFSYYVKELIKKDMKNSGVEFKEPKQTKRNTKFEL